MAECDDIFELNLPVLGAVPVDYFDGQQHITDGRLACLLNALSSQSTTIETTIGDDITALEGATRTYHEPTILPESGSNSPGQQPDLALIGTTLVAEFTVNTDSSYRFFKIPGNYVEGAAFHIHWTKESGIGGDGDESGNGVRWRLSYTVTPGNNADINVAPTVVELDDTYDDAGTTTRIVYRTPNVAAPGFVANYYVGVCIEAVTPDGSALGCEPALVTADLTYIETINK